MKTFDVNQTVSYQFKQSALKGAIVTFFQSVIRYACNAFGFLLLACLTIVVFAVLQILFIGGMDMFGFAPQISFLVLNVALIVFLAWFVLPLFRSRNWRLWERSRTQNEATFERDKSFSASLQASNEAICKLLIIKRIGSVKKSAGQETVGVSDKRSEGNEIAISVKR